ncbi:Transmembrane protein TauE-like [Dillenia turbinata]|uniref:Transmembrane protein TauE-like n=1 Tax=Dillenia turbinata TaxID=194707 RepID=A0AAN8VZI2_9MAGN
MDTKGLLLYLLPTFSAAIASVFFLNDPKSTKPLHQSFPNSLNSSLPQYPYGSATSGSSCIETLWPDLEFGWRLVVATIIGFLGSAFGTVGGVGGGGIFVPMLTLVIGFDTKSAAALSKCMIMAASTSSVWYNLRVQHPTKDVPIIDYDLSLLFQPMLMLGITIGVALSVVFPYWLITILIIILFMGTSSRSFFKAIQMWNGETIFKKEMEKQQETLVNSHGELLKDTEYELVNPRPERTGMQNLCFNLRWKRILVLVVLWFCFVVIQIVKAKQFGGMQFMVLGAEHRTGLPIAFLVFFYEAIKLYKESKKRKKEGNTELICEASIDWTTLNLSFCALCGVLGGTVGGLLGSGGGFILGPLLLEMGVIPHVASATATFVMMFSSSLSVVEFYFLKRFPITYALYLMAVSVMAGFFGQFMIRKMVAILKRASIIVFVLSSVIFASAITMGVIGIGTSITMIREHEYMGFESFCDSQ